MKLLKRFVGLILIAVFFIGLFVACEYYGRSAKNFYMDTPGQTATGSIDFAKTSVDRLVENYVNNEIERDLVITAVGDMKFYEWQLERAYNEEKKTFDFSKSFTYISKYFENSHFVLGDIETTLAGINKGSDNQWYGYTADRDNYLFNTPEVLAKNLSDIGFNLINTANEHALDSGVEGLKATIKHLTDEGLDVMGTRTSSSENNYIIEKVSGVPVGFISYTNVLNNQDASFYGDAYTDGNSYYDDGYYDDGYYDDGYYEDDGYYDEGYSAEGDAVTETSETQETAQESEAAKEDTASDLVNYLYEYDDSRIQTMCDEVKALRAQTEAVVVMLHFGDQYQTAPGPEDTALCQRLVDAGADVIFGSHTHVPGQIRVMNSQNPDGTVRKALVVYSMGNFLTSQQYIDESGQHRDMGYMASVILKKSKAGTRVSGINLVPVYSNWTDDNIATVPVLEAYDDAESFGFIFDDTAKRRIKSAYEEIFPQLIADSGLNYVMEDYQYKISLEY